MLFMLIAHVIETENAQPTPIARVAMSMLASLFEEAGITTLEEQKEAIDIIKTKYYEQFGKPKKTTNTNPSVN